MSLHVNCPHCRNPIEVADAAAADVACPSCGSSFRLEQASTVRQSPAEQPIPLGKFQLLETLGMGAFGIVYKARDPQMDRLVAVKVPRAGNVGSGQSLERFLREARSVARLRHPSIVPVHEVGEYAGLPYLVSEFVSGVTLSDWLTAHRPTFLQAADLIIQLAEALDYAHAQGVVHRDIKPANIMLEINGATVIPRLMDFGLAKRDAGEITMTIEGQVLGTPAYMSPEQARGEGHRVDGRSDVYSLGVVLYEMLAGELPFRGNVRMLLHQVLHDEPRWPRKINDRIPRDLETICLKAMAKEPGRRYARAGALAEDLRRFRDGRPILARPVGPVEKLSRWARRNPALAAALGALALIIVASLAGLTVLYVNAERQRIIAESERHNAEHKEAGARAIAKFYEEHVLTAARPKGWEGGAGKEVSLKEALDKAAPKIDAAFAGQPELEAAVRNTLGTTYHLLGELESARPHLEKAYEIRGRTLGPDHPDTLNSQFNLARQRLRQGKLEVAEPLFRQLLEKQRRLLGPDHQDTLWTQSHLGWLLLERDQLEEAEKLLRKAVEAQQRSPDPDLHHTLHHAQHDLAIVLGRKGKQEEALALFRLALEGRRHSLGEDHPDTLRTMGSLAWRLTQAGRLEEAEPLCRRSLEVRRRVLGDEHPETLWVESQLGDLLSQKGDYPEAEKLLRRCLAAERKRLGGGDHYHADTLESLGNLLAQTGRAAEAEPLLRECLNIREQKLAPTNWWTASARGSLGNALAQQGKFAEAEPLLLAGHEGLIKATGTPPMQISRSLDRIIEMYEKWGKPEQAEAWRQKRRAGP